MRVKVHDPMGPVWSRTALPMIGLLYCSLSVVSYFNPGPPLDPLFYYGVGIGLLGPFALGRNKTRDRELVLESGLITMKGLIPEVIRSKDVKSAVAADLSDGRSVLALELAQHGTHPVTFEFASPLDCRYAREALGLSDVTFGKLEWERTGLFVSIISKTLLLSWALGVGYFIDHGQIGKVLWFSILFLSVTFYASVLVLKMSSSVALNPKVLTVNNKIVFGADNISFVDPLSSVSFRFRDIESVDLEPVAGRFLEHCYLWITERPKGGKPSPKHRFRVEIATLLRVGITYSELEIVCEVIRDRMRRGETNLESAIEDVLSRTAILDRTDETVGEWIARLNQTGEAIRTGAKPPFSLEDLWTLCADPNVHPNRRFSATRVLFVADAHHESRLTRAISRVNEPAHGEFLALALQREGLAQSLERLRGK